MTENIYNPEFVKGLFNRMSSSYERMHYITSFEFSIRWRRQFLNSFSSTKEKVEIMDLLTGMGENWETVRRKFPNANISALDFSEEMVKNAKLKNKEYFLSWWYVKDNGDYVRTASEWNWRINSVFNQNRYIQVNLITNTVQNAEKFYKELTKDKL